MVPLVARAAFLAGKRLRKHVIKQSRKRSRITSSSMRTLAKQVEKRSAEVRENELLGALEFEGEIGNDVHTALAEDGFWEEDLGNVKQFYKVWIAEVRLEFPLRSNKPSDRACMMRWLTGKMRERGMRITHIADAAPRIVAMAINPSRAEVEAEEMAEAADKWRKPLKATWLERLLGIRPPGAARPVFMARE